MNRFLNGKEITTAIFCHYKIIMTYKRRQCRNLFSYSIHRQTSNSTRPIYIQVRIILTPFRTSCTHTFRNPHEQFFEASGPISCTKSCVILFISTKGTSNSFATLRGDSKYFHEYQSTLLHLEKHSPLTNPCAHHLRLPHFYYSGNYDGQWH